ncbi:WD40 repeat domain-containing protein [Rhizobium leguminosarum]|uniref:WD40 repeat domain-containing protein n=1 Tax=Rhizobium leguminosarum TaxID=384 RepID=UPI000FEC476D|nr:WD40 repeat domain-containing protein [Rhizobium leguminosarum]RWX24509.1 WD40 repeat domain-containing protein [Rhizobium leguminosarum]
MIPITPSDELSALAQRAEFIDTVDRKRKIFVWSFVAAIALAATASTSLIFAMQQKTAADRAYELATRAEASALRERQLTQHLRETSNIKAISFDRRTFVSAAGSLVKSDTNRILATLSTAGVSLAQFNATATTIAIVPNGTDRRVMFFDASTGSQLGTILPGSEPLSIVFAPSGDLLSVVCLNGAVELWDTASMRIRSVFYSQNRPDIAAFSPDSSRIVEADEAGNIRLWDVTKSRLIKKWEGPSIPKVALGFSDDGTEVLAGFADGQQIIYNVSESGERRFWVTLLR